MEQLFKLILYLHIACGTLALLSGTINMVRKKGDKLHTQIGLVFLYSLLSTGFCSFVLAIIHPSLFLFMVGVFTIHLVGTGQRYLSLKQLHNNQQAQLVDWALLAMMGITALVLLGYGVTYLVQGSLFGLVYIVFGNLGLRSVYNDIKNYQGKITNQNYWLVLHLQRMIGGYIAAITAFLVVNSKYFPDAIQGTILWLLPTIIFVPLMIVWSRKIKNIPVTSN